jgi:hypothetical protein
MQRREPRNGPATIAWLACAGLAVLTPAGPALGQAHANDEPAPASITLVNPGAMPFSSAELTQALLARRFPEEEGSTPRVRVAAAAAGSVAVEVGERSRVLALGQRNGPEAARVVALVIAELMSDGPEVDPDGGDAAPVSPVLIMSAPVAPPATAVMSRPVRLCVTGGVAKGTGSEERLAGTFDADVTVPLGPGRVRLTPSLGLVYMPTRDARMTHEVAYSGAVVRLLGGGGWGPVDLFAGPFVAPYSITGATQHLGALFGAEALARVAVPVFRRTRLVFATRAHVYGNRVRIVWENLEGYATPRVELTIAVGVAWDWTP